ncbi:hypothetical protein C8R43DRAFT_959303 [Mycena crocata]|nr:hypothetical protein C8R43DRAFT_959303 [Mycena crocata]
MLPSIIGRSVFPRREDFVDTGEYVDAVFEEDRRHIRRWQRINPNLGRPSVPVTDKGPSLAEGISSLATRDTNSSDGDDSVGILPVVVLPDLSHLIHRSTSSSPPPSDPPSTGASSSAATLPASHRPSTPPPGVPHCSNCHSTWTSGQDLTWSFEGWFPSVLEPTWKLCNACRHYEADHNRHRPLELAQVQSERRERRNRPRSPSPPPTPPRQCTPAPDVPRCSNCSNTWTSGHGWCHSVLEPSWTLCTACRKYEKKNNKHRPLSLAQTSWKRRARQLGLPYTRSTSPSRSATSNLVIPRPPTPPPDVLHCSNCHSTWNAKKCWPRSKLKPEWSLCNTCWNYETRHHHHRPWEFAMWNQERGKITRPKKKQ